MPTPRDMPQKKNSGRTLEDIVLPQAKETPKRQFVRPDHLSQRPLRSAELANLRKTLDK